MTPAARLAQALFMEANEIAAVFGGVADEVVRDDAQVWVDHLRGRADTLEGSDRSEVAA